MSKESFKSFVRNNPSLIRYVRDNQMTWQKFYEIYDLYGENQKVWSKYLEIGGTSNEKTSASSLLGDTSLKDVFNAVKKIDLDSVKKGVDGLQKIIGLAQDIVSAKSGSSSSSAPSYQRRPMYKYFED